MYSNAKEYDTVWGLLSSQRREVHGERETGWGEEQALGVGVPQRVHRGGEVVKSCRKKFWPRWRCS